MDESKQEDTGYLEQNPVRDEDIVNIVITDKGTVCMDSERYEKYTSNQNKEWRFGVSANITHSPHDENGELHYSTRAFKPGTKIYLGGKDWDSSNSSIGVIGMNRFGRFVVESVPVCFIENVRTQRIYKPTVLKIMDHLEAMDGWEWWKRTVADKKDSERFVKEWNAK